MGQGICFRRVLTSNWLVADQLGTPRIILDKTGSLATTKRHDYLPFGEELYAGMGGRTTALGYKGSTIRQKFTGYERDGETGLDFAQARYHSSNLGRFTSSDPFGGSMRTADPQSFNRYSYVENHPLTRTDTSGLSSAKPVGGVLPGANGALGRVGPGRGMDPSFGKPRRPDQRTTQPSGKVSEAEAVVDLVVDQPMGAPGVGTQTEQAALSAEAATNAVRSVVLPMVNNNKQCRNFLDGMLSELERRTRISPIRRSFLATFNTLSKQVGFFDGSGLFDDYGQTTLIGGNLSIGINFSKAEPTGPFTLEINSIHEVFHAAARGDLYKEYDMAKAAYDVGKRMSLVPALVREPMQPGSKVADAYNTRLINQIIFFACKAN